MPDNKTKPTDADVDAFIAAITDAAQRADVESLRWLLQEATGEEPRMWGGSIIGFGRYQYRYDSGHSGEAALVGMSPRRGKITLYLTGGFEPHADLMSRLGRHATGKGCLYIRRLSDVDTAVLRELVHASFVRGQRLWPDAR